MVAFLHDAREERDAGVQEQPGAGAEHGLVVVAELVAVGLERGDLVTLDLGRVVAVVGDDADETGPGVDVERRGRMIDQGGVFEVGALLPDDEEHGLLVAVGDAHEAGDLVLLGALELVEADGLDHLLRGLALEGLGHELRLEDLSVLAEDLEEDLPVGGLDAFPVGGVERSALLAVQLDGHVALELNDDVAVVVEVVVLHVARLVARVLTLGVVVVTPLDVVAGGLEGRGDGLEQREGQVALDALEADADAVLGLGQDDLVEHHVGVLELDRAFVAVRADDDLAAEELLRVPDDDLLRIGENGVGLLHDHGHESDEGDVARRNGVGLHWIYLFVSPLTEVRTALGPGNGPETFLFALLKRIGGADWRHTNGEITQKVAWLSNAGIRLFLARLLKYCLENYSFRPRISPPSFWRRAKTSS